MKAYSEHPIRAIIWRLNNIAVNRIIVPARGGIVYDKHLRYAQRMTYPGLGWNAQFFILQAKSGGMWIRTADEQSKVKTLEITPIWGRGAGMGAIDKPESKAPLVADLSLCLEPNRPFSLKEYEERWLIEAYKGDWTVPAKTYKEWMAKTFKLTPLRSRKHLPGWARDTKLIVYLGGAYSEQEKRLKELSHIVNARSTIAYTVLTNAMWPEYWPDENLGGKKGLEAFLGSAHKLGYKIMVYTNLNGMDLHHPLFEEFKQCWLGGGWKEFGVSGGGLQCADMNPHCVKWRSFFISKLKRLMDHFEIDSIFLDQGATHAHKQFIKEIREMFPGIPLMGEFGSEDVLCHLDMNQHWLIPQYWSHPFSGESGGIPVWKVHPIDAYLFSDFSLLFVHLTTPHPNHPAFGLMERENEMIGLLPAFHAMGHFGGSTGCYPTIPITLENKDVKRFFDRANVVIKEGLSPYPSALEFVKADFTYVDKNGHIVVFLDKPRRITYRESAVVEGVDEEWSFKIKADEPFKPLSRYARIKNTCLHKWNRKGHH